MPATSSTLPRSSAELIGSAVHRHRALSVDGLLERLFTRAFSHLVYPLIWEDARIDLDALALSPASRIVTIASGGCNVLNYLTAGPAHIHAVDLNATHIALGRLKLEALRRLERHADFYTLFGRAGDRRPSDIYATHIRAHLDDASRAYWDGRDHRGRARITRFDRGFHRYGLLGRCIGTAHALAHLYGRDPRRMMQARTRREQAEIFASELAPLFDRRLVRWLLGHRAALYGLGIPPAQYTALAGETGHMADVVRARLRRLACDFDLDDNPFAWQAFQRSYARDGAGPLPSYLEAENFAALKSGIDRVSFEQVSFTEFLARQPAASLDRYVLLDAQDWMTTPDLARLWGEITRTARPGARVIFRTAGEETILPGRVPDEILGRWHYAAERSQRLTRADRSAIYGGFHLYGLGHGL